ncbi:ubiquinol-cytochrome c reductase iron-sulfur subunit [Rubrobacter radiotolerans]|uniref:Cytochrome bc1 complex Rieske iron-sulfur subunit n=2 Tax=Rubrobacter radiotolerans TaxID=42256 RepID=A0AB35SZG0_RUBRA|nr:Rieske 2Fe-2S domain-containing protein [Rubrobacter radiotolerans]MDX5892984.1 Rieske 2Fe-2S domain-containing protein [Rubrobacter radiotolerans]
MAELQKDRMTRSDFLALGVTGGIIGAVLTIPPAAFLLGPVIDVGILGQSDVREDWQEVGPVADVAVEEPSVFIVEFPIDQIYGEERVQNAEPDFPRSQNQFTLRHAVWLSWKAPVEQPARYGNQGAKIGEPQKPAFLENKSEGFTPEEIREVEESINVLNNSCAHLGCPVRWITNVDGQGEFLCPCHGGIYDINGDWYGGPPPRGMYRYTQYEVRENGRLYVKHGFDIDEGIPGINETEPYVI